MLSLARVAACLTVNFPPRISESMVRRMFPFSTPTQCFAAGTDQLRAAARTFPPCPSSLRAVDVLLAFEAASQKFFHAVRPAMEAFESRFPTHLCACVYAMLPP